MRALLPLWNSRKTECGAIGCLPGLAVRAAPFALLAIFFLGACFAETIAQPLDNRHLDAVHAQLLEWIKQRAAMPALGVYQDFRAARAVPGQSLEQQLLAAKDAGVRVVLSTKEAPWNGMHEGILFLAGVGDGLDDRGDLSPFLDEAAGTRVKPPRGLEGKFKQYPDEVFAAAGAALFEERERSRGDRLLAAAFRNTSLHILARELNEGELRASLAAGRAYIAHDWLCDPTGFSFIAETNVGAFEMGDHAPAINTVIQARLPVPAKLKLLHDGAVVVETDGAKLNYPVKQKGSYRLEASLIADGEERPWISTDALYVGGPPGIALPLGTSTKNVEARKDITYTGGDPADGPKHKLDLYLPEGKQNFPVLMFVHGGTWRSGDRSLYAALGYRFASFGIGVAIPSYRLMPKNPHPAQIEDVAAAFAWVYKHAAQWGGDTQRLYLVGHSAGGHLAALLALDDTYLKKYDVPPGAIHGVAALSGVYDVSRLPEFISGNGARDASPLDYVHREAPPFLITYCQFDYLGLPKQARDFAAALKVDFVATELVYVPNENHFTEIVDILKDHDPTLRAILNFVK